MSLPADGLVAGGLEHGLDLLEAFCRRDGRVLAELMVEASDEDLKATVQGLLLALKFVTEDAALEHRMTGDWYRASLRRHLTRKVEEHEG